MTHTDATASQAVPATAERPSSFKSLDHIKLPVHSLKRTVEFYTKVFPFVHEPKYDHFTPDHKVFAQMFIYENLIVEARYHPVQASAQRGWDPITWGVSTRKDLEDWSRWFDAHGVKHSPILTGIKGWLMGCEDPDGRVVRLYVQDEEHEWTDHPDKHEHWLGTVQADPEGGHVSK